jgi:hypothetical protein
MAKKVSFFMNFLRFFGDFTRETRQSRRNARGRFFSPAAPRIRINPGSRLVHLHNCYTIAAYYRKIPGMMAVVLIPGRRSREGEAGRFGG